MIKDNKLLSRYIIYFLVISVFIVGLLYIDKKAKIEAFLDQKAKQTYTNYNALYHKYKSLSDVIFKTEINTKEVIDIYKNAYKSDNNDKALIREKLYKKLSGLYNLLQENRIKQLHFHLPDNESFLRFHRPNKFGDNLSQVRSTVKYVNETKKPIDGFEEGRIFNGYRFIYPLFDENAQHIGSVEISFGSLVLLSVHFDHQNQSTLTLFDKV